MGQFSTEPHRDEGIHHNLYHHGTEEDIHTPSTLRMQKLAHVHKLVFIAGIMMSGCCVDVIERLVLKDETWVNSNLIKILSSIINTLYCLCPRIYFYSSTSEVVMARGTMFSGCPSDTFLWSRYLGRNAVIKILQVWLRHSVGINEPVRYLGGQLPFWPHCSPPQALLFGWYWSLFLDNQSFSSRLSFFLLEGRRFLLFGHYTSVALGIIVLGFIWIKHTSNTKERETDFEVEPMQRLVCSLISCSRCQSNLIGLLSCW